ncbi:MAG: hypothetical protein MAG451_00185 [Anaerolineales bacterium]|nr:hypothetical protein [Anaerolineales bacterium]
MITYVTMHRGTTRETRTQEEDPSHFREVDS